MYGSRDQRRIWAADFIIVGTVGKGKRLPKRVTRPFSALYFLTALSFSLVPSCGIFVLGKNCLTLITFIVVKPSGY